jgi:hypothetical protein
LRKEKDSLIDANMKLTIDMKTLLEDNQAMMKSKNESVA